MLTRKKIMIIWVSSGSAIHMWKPAGRIKNIKLIYLIVWAITIVKVVFISLIKQHLHVLEIHSHESKLSFLNDIMYFNNRFSYFDCFFYWNKVKLATTFKVCIAVLHTKVQFIYLNVIRWCIRLYTPFLNFANCRLVKKVKLSLL